MLGDEILDSGCSLENVSSVAAFVRETWPEAVIYANEGLNVMLTGGFNGVAASVHLPHTTQNGWISVSPLHHLCCDPHAFIFSNDVPCDSIAG